MTTASMTTAPRFRNWDFKGTALTFLGGALVLAPVNLIAAVTFSAFAKQNSFAHAQLRFLAANQWIMWTIVGISMLAGSALLIYVLTRSTRRFGQWLEQHYPGELSAADAGVLNENQPVVRATGIYRSRAVGFMYGELEIERQDLPVAA